jgi:hypothetical protein
MAGYRCVLIGLTGQVEAVQDIFSITNAGAVAIARRMRKRSPEYVGFELWRGQQMLHIEGPTADPKRTGATSATALGARRQCPQR